MKIIEDKVKGPTTEERMAAALERLAPLLKALLDKPDDASTAEAIRELKSSLSLLRPVTPPAPVVAPAIEFPPPPKGFDVTVTRRDVNDRIKTIRIERID